MKKYKSIQCPNYKNDIQPFMELITATNEVMYYQCSECGTVMRVVIKNV